MYDCLDVVQGLSEYAEVTDIPLHDEKTRVVTVLIKVPAPARGEVVEDDDLRHSAVGEQSIDEVAPDESGATYNGPAWRQKSGVEGQRTDSHLVATS